MITEITYDKRKKTMTVEYDDGPSRCYLNVSEVAYCACVSAANVAAHLCKYIAPVYIQIDRSQEGQPLESLVYSAV